jgi:murein DD-endopeptidase MepM/ murein hydrolase activator NlpD
MKKKYFTFLYVPSQNTGLKTIRIPKWLALAFALAISALAVATATTVLRHSSRAADAHRLSQLEKENEVLRGQLAEFGSDIDQLKRQVDQNFDFQRKARLLASLDPLGDDVTEVGVGGPNSGYTESVSTLDPETRANVTSLKDDVEKLIRQAKLQSESYQDILSQLSDSEKLLGATPSIRPVPVGFVSSRFGRRMDPFTGRSTRHMGVDYSARLGTPIFATADGIVTYAGKWADFGLVVEISHGYDFVTRYAHTSKVLVKKGQRVKRGDVIARVGSTGRSTATHLHYEVLYKGQRVNPLAYVLTGKEVIE